MSNSVTALLNSVYSRLAALREYRTLYNRELALDFNPIGQFWGLDENTSSQILAFFLDPTENHAQGDAFLREFLSLIAQKTGNRELLELGSPILVQPEFSIPNAKPDEGGRMDIVLQFDSPKYCVAIENKIWAYDQEKQLDRYEKYLERAYPASHVLIYLTPDGREPSKGSYSKDLKTAEAERIRFCLLSWSKDIDLLLNTWKGLCHADRVCSFLRDYKSSIHAEMGGGLDMNEERTIDELVLKSTADFEAAVSIVEAWPSIKSRLIRKFTEEMKTISNDKGLVWEISKDFGVKWSGFNFARENWKHFHIYFEFDTNNFHKMNYGIAYQKEPPDNHPNIEEALKVIKAACTDDGHEESKWSPVNYWMEPKFLNWDTTDVLKELMKGQKSKLYEGIINKIDYLIPIIDEAEKILR